MGLQRFKMVLNSFMMVSDHRKAFWHDLRPDFGAGNSENAIFELNFVHLRALYKSYITLRVCAGVSKGTESIYGGLGPYVVYLTWFEAWFWCWKGLNSPPPAQYTPKLQKWHFRAKFCVFVVQIQKLCYPGSLYRGFKGCWIHLWWSQVI